MPNMPCGASGGFLCHFRNMRVLRDRVQLAVRTVGVVNLKLAWVGWAIGIVKSLQRNERVLSFNMEVFAGKKFNFASRWSEEKV